MNNGLNTFTTKYDICCNDFSHPMWNGVQFLHTGFGALTTSNQPYINKRKTTCLKWNRNKITNRWNCAKYSYAPTGATYTKPHFKPCNGRRRR